MKFKSLFILLTAITLFSCSSRSNKQKDVAAEAKDSIALQENFEKGKVIDQVTCKNDASQSYAMYLPTTYSTKKKFPIIISFDPHGAGKLPVSMYKDLAEQYGYIIVGSNNSKNGQRWEESKNISAALLNDVENRLSVNTDRIYLLGFSGGARVANSLTIPNGAIAGVICCGAVSPVTEIKSARNNYTFMGMIGNEDFNYIEMRKYDMVDIAGHNIKHALITFDGKHEWPAKNIMDDAFWWLELNEMRKNNVAKNDSTVVKRFRPLVKQIETYQKNNQAFEAYQLCRKTAAFYDGLVDLSYCYATFKSLQTNADVDRELKTEEIMWRKEEDLKQYYLCGFQTGNYLWWEKEITSLNQKIKSGKNKGEVLMNKRVLNYLSLAAYMQASGTLQQGNLGAADHFCKVYALIDPTNSEAYYLMAELNAIQKKNSEAIRSLNEAVKNGFTDKTRLQNDSTFSGIKNTKEFNAVFTTIDNRSQYPTEKIK